MTKKGKFKMSIVDALKKLVVAFGGAEAPEAVPGSNVAEVVEELSKSVTPITPPEPSGDSGQLTVHVDATGETVTCDTEWADIVAADTAGKNLICHVDLSVGGTTIHFVTGDYYRIMEDSALSAMIFAITGANGDPSTTYTVQVIHVTLSGDGNLVGVFPVAVPD